MVVLGVSDEGAVRDGVKLLARISCEAIIPMQ